MDGPQSPEARRVWELSDEQILKVLEERASQLAIAKALGRLVKMLELAEGKAGKYRIGVQMAISFTKLYSQAFAPGSPGHPFRDFQSSAEQILGTASLREAQSNFVKTAIILREKPEIGPSLKRAAVSKVQRVENLIMGQNGSTFHREDIASLLPPDITTTDLGNGINKLLSTGKITRFSPGVYRKCASKQQPPA